MNQITAEQIARKVRAFKHADKLCKEIEKKGKVTIILNNTGLTFVVQNGDPIFIHSLELKTYLILVQIYFHEDD